MKFFCRPGATGVRALFSIAALLAVSSTVVPGAIPQRARPLRTGGGFVQRLVVSRTGGGSALGLRAEIARPSAAFVPPAVPAFALATAALPAVPAAARWTFTAIVPPPLFARPWRTLSRLESRPPPIA